MATQSSIDQLNSFLRGEMSAVETYRLAIERLGSEGIRPSLETCQRSHEARVATLREMIVRLGGEPAEGSGAWGAFAKSVQAGADVLGKKVAVASLEEGEDHGVADYQRDAKNLDAEARRLVEAELLPAQLQTHRIMRDLKASQSMD